MRSEELKADWHNLLGKLSKQFPGNGDLDLDGVLLLIGTQELQMGFIKTQKDVKINLLHVGVCSVLEPYGYYEFEKRDDEVGRIFKFIKQLPALRAGEQSILMKQAVVNYFKNKDYI